MSADLTARIAELAALIDAKLAEEYASADMLAVQGDDWHVDKHDPAIVRSEYFHVAARCDERELAHADRRAWHIARYDPGRAKRRVKATREVVADILTAQHYAPEVEYYSCSQAQEGQYLIGGPTGHPGSGCSDPERAGQPCDCGRDERVVGLLGIIAGEWEVA